MKKFNIGDMVVYKSRIGNKVLAGKIISEELNYPHAAYAVDFGKAYNVPELEVKPVW